MLILLGFLLLTTEFSSENHSAVFVLQSVRAHTGVSVTRDIHVSVSECCLSFNNFLVVIMVLDFKENVKKTM